MIITFIRHIQKIVANTILFSYNLYKIAIIILEFLDTGCRFLQKKEDMFCIKYRKLLFACYCFTGYF